MICGDQSSGFPVNQIGRGLCRPIMTNDDDNSVDQDDTGVMMDYSVQPASIGSRNNDDHQSFALYSPGDYIALRLTTMMQVME